METQNLNALIHLESLAAPMADMAKTITVTETEIKQEMSEITSTINDLEVRISSSMISSSDSWIVHLNTHVDVYSGCLKKESKISGI